MASKTDSEPMVLSCMLLRGFFTTYIRFPGWGHSPAFNDSKAEIKAPTYSYIYPVGMAWWRSGLRPQTTFNAHAHCSSICPADTRWTGAASITSFLSLRRNISSVLCVSSSSRSLTSPAAVGTTFAAPVFTEYKPTPGLARYARTPSSVWCSTRVLWEK